MQMCNVKNAKEREGKWEMQQTTGYLLSVSMLSIDTAAAAAAAGIS